MKADDGKGENKITEDTNDPEKEDVQVLEEHSSPETSSTSHTVTDTSSPQMPRDDDSVQEIPSDEKALPPKKRVLCL